MNVSWNSIIISQCLRAAESTMKIWLRWRRQEDRNHLLQHQRNSSEQSRNQVICRSSSIRQMCSLIMLAVRHTMRLPRLTDAVESCRMIPETCAVASTKTSNSNNMRCRTVMSTKTSSTPGSTHNKHHKYKIDFSSHSQGANSGTLPPKSSMNHSRARIQNTAGPTGSTHMKFKRKGLHMGTPIDHNKEDNTRAKAK